ncbi:hypothetical protein ACS0TY_020988 [Phlomoides rotata]
MRLQYLLDLRNNSFSESIPSSFGKMISLEVLISHTISCPIPNGGIFSRETAEALTENVGLYGTVKGLSPCDVSGKPRDLGSHGVSFFGGITRNMLSILNHFLAKEKGGSRTIYRADLPTGHIAVVKRLNISDLCDVPLANLCSFPNKIGALTEVEKVKIIQRVVHVLAYLHHNSSLPIVHHDITTNNILFESE